MQDAAATNTSCTNHPEKQQPTNNNHWWSRRSLLTPAPSRHTTGIGRLVAAAQAREAPVQRVADAVAGKFCYGVMAASAATFTFWQTLGALWVAWWCVVCHTAVGAAVWCAWSAVNIVGRLPRGLSVGCVCWCLALFPLSLPLIRPTCALATFLSTSQHQQHQQQHHQPTP